MFDLPSVLFAVVDTGLWPIEQVRAWADQVIDRSAKPAVWLMDLCMASTAREAGDVIQGALRARETMLDDDIGELVVGLLYERFRHSTLPRDRFISEVADALDAYEPPAIDVETWNETMGTTTAVPDSLQALLEGMCERAADAVVRLGDVAQAVAHPFFLEV